MAHELLILRHAKSDWRSAADSDHERPLAPRGIRAAGVVGRFLRRGDAVPDMVLTSTAVRARTTAALAAEAGEWDCPIEITEDLYDVSVAGWLSRVAAVSDDVGRLLVAGHEPACSGVLRHLTRATARFPTAAVACVSVECRWRDLVQSRGLLLWFTTPRLLEATEE